MDARISVLSFPLDESSVRLVTHSDLGDDLADAAADKLAYVVENWGSSNS